MSAEISKYKSAEKEKEYIEIAKIYGDIDSPSFINGILDKIARNNTHKLVQKDSIPH